MKDQFKKIKTAFISVYNKDNILNLVQCLDSLNIQIISTGGTEKFIKNLGINVTSVESLTNFPSILGGRVKTLHPNVFGGILNRRNSSKDLEEIEKFKISNIDMVIVDLYPFEETVNDNMSSEQDIIEKIDIGGVSLIRAAAKNFKDVFVVPSTTLFNDAVQIIEKNNGSTNENARKLFAKKSFHLCSNYDSNIYNWFNHKQKNLKLEFSESRKLRYGENPHQTGKYYGNLNSVFKQIHGKEISYNNLLDIDSAINLISDFNINTFCILKHNNPCGVASEDSLIKCWNKALEGDPISAFGGVLITNGTINVETANKINKLFFEIIIAPEYDLKALNILQTKKNRIILKLGDTSLIAKVTYRSILNGIVYQERDVFIDCEEILEKITKLKPTKAQLEDLLFASIICKHTKSNAIVLIKNKQLIGIGCGQTSRVDALKQAILKAKSFGFNLEGSVLASDAFFPFPDCIEIASKQGIKAVIQPGGSINDKLSIDCCNKNKIAMVLTKVRHFKH
jgi:phosphoribosylaminoimidazolecarboxamide formyltransferase/IMP cyclohydrolase